MAYLTQRATMIKMRVQLGLFDPDNKGLLTEAQLEDFLEHFSRSIPSLENMPVSYSRIHTEGLWYTHLYTMMCE